MPSIAPPATLSAITAVIRSGAHSMRPAAYFAATIILLGLYVAVAAVFAFTPTVIGLGILAISAMAAVALMAGGQEARTR
jgi:hypothetical protein